MPATTVTLPNIKKMFVPDEGYKFFDIDLAQADAQVVAWEANDDKLKEIFHDPTRDLHSENCIDIFDDLNDDLRYLAKRGVHATNYLATAFTLSRALGISLRDAKRFQARWFAAHPGIVEWHEIIEEQLFKDRTITNKFGAKIKFYDRIDTILTNAVAWIPQSTVGIVINKGILNVYNTIPEVQLLLQVHDSSAGQYPIGDESPEFLTRLRRCYEIIIPYDDPLTIGVGISTSLKSWGDCKPQPWPEAA